MSDPQRYDCPKTAAMTECADGDYVLAREIEERDARIAELQTRVEQQRKWIEDAVRSCAKKECSRYEARLRDADRFADEMERERDEARARIAELEAQLEGADGRAAVAAAFMLDAQEERDEARAKIRDWHRNEQKRFGAIISRAVFRARAQERARGEGADASLMVAWRELGAEKRLSVDLTRERDEARAQLAVAEALLRRALRFIDSVNGVEYAERDDDYARGWFDDAAWRDAPESTDKDVVALLGEREAREADRG